MRERKTSVAKRLFGVFTATGVLVVGLVCVYVLSSRHANRQLDTVLHVYNRKLDIGTQVELATTEMQGSQRGLMLSYAMRDPEASVPYIKLYADNAKKIDGLLGELKPLLASDEERNAFHQIVENRTTWAPRFQALIELCQSGDTAAAYKLRNQNKVLSAAMHASATALVAEQRKTLENVQSAAVKTANWIAAIVISLCAFLGVMTGMAIRKINRDLRGSIENLCHGAEQVAVAAGQISSTSNHLAQGASEQAATLQETSASSQEVASMTRQNAEHAQQAVALMTGLYQRVNEATANLNQMKASMQDITASSSEIAKIIQVIDEIAFQTNILALNAAVEAARAGEAGMGFAVVADEVRSLAQRSAQAAKDTATLIERSIRKSGEGGKQFADVSVSIQAITESVGRVKILVDDVNSASAEQARGVDQISNAVLELDKVTQQNASSAEESAAAAKTMSSESQALKDVVENLKELVGSNGRKMASEPVA